MADKDPRVMTARERYESLCPAREPYLRRAREASALTLPSLILPEGYSGATDLEQPYQSLGSRGVNNLSSKFLLALFPPGSSFARLTIDDFLKEKIEARAGGGKDGDDARTVFEEALAKVERAVINRMEQAGSRATLSEALKHLLVGGNVLVQELGDGGLRMYPLTQYVCKRDPQGNPVDIVVKQALSRMTLPPAALALVGDAGTERQTDKNGDETIDLFTRQRRIEGRWEVYQEVEGAEVPKSRGYYPIDNPAFMAWRFAKSDGEDYSRGYVEEYIGDLRTVESLSQSVVDFAAEAARIVRFVNEAGVTDKDEYAKARSGAVLDGTADDITTAGLDKVADFQVASSVLERAEKRLEQAFLLFSGVQRDAERVTAEEIRQLAAELETVSAGTYSVFGKEIQLPLFSRVMLSMQKKHQLPMLPKDAVSPKIVTGLAALGRTSDLQKLDILLNGLDQQFGTEAVAEYVPLGAVIRRKATALGIDVADMVRTEEQVQQIRQQKNMQSLTEKLGGPVIGAMSAAQQNQETPQNGR